ncbi:ImmA/IrrE family metallo-endopeptidase [Bifidobacterium dentium]|uniref:ImmA/IrrE family metallo-endopeptidase n=1 Tax=Bifidobacterium dentium TaxID=1689 RepID=UPI003D166D3C
MLYGDMRRAIVGLPITTSSALLPDGWQGAYCKRTETILIDRRLTYSGKRCALVHELIHWQYGDDSCDPSIRSIQESRTRRETAMLLIDPAEYAMLERVYEANLWYIAQELNVTMQVLWDYQDLLKSRRPVTAQPERDSD